MPRGIPALVEPALLVWARQSAGLRLDEAAKKGQIKPETLHQWEQGEARPSIPQLRRLGEVYKRPLAVFFLPEPPKGFDPQREFRRLPGLTPQNESPELRLALRTALFRREAARELYERLGEPLPSFEASAHPTEDPEIVGQRIRELPGITWEDQLEWPSAYAALNAWREAIEGLGILVFQTGGIKLEEMRGTGVTHGPLPVIVLNNADAPHGRIFTLIHEFIHIMFANGGHLTSAIEGRRYPEDQILERASNRFAAATLMPRKQFLAELEGYPEVLRGGNDALRPLANRIKVSAEAILRRLVSLQISINIYREKRKKWQQRSWFTPPQGGGGPPIQLKVISSMGRSFVTLILEGYQRNAISSGDVADCLGVKLKHLERISGELLSRPPTPALT